MDNSQDEVFPGFWHPDLNEGHTKLPHELIERLNRIESLAELKIILYIMRHTWGFQEFDKPKKITVDEFMSGRKRSDGTRFDNGTGLSSWGVQEGIAKALADGFITCKVDDHDKGRIKKKYAINIYKEEQKN